MSGHFTITPIPPTGGADVAGLLILFALATVLIDNIPKTHKMQATTPQTPLVKTVRVDKIENNQAEVNMGVEGPYLKCSHSTNVTIHPTRPDEARIHYKNNRFSWHFYNNDRHSNNRAHFNLIYHDSPYGQVELLCKGMGWNGEVGAIKFVILPPFQGGH